ncbi:hypothetical protein PR048_023385, partial [Dryococelus australis]
MGLGISCFEDPKYGEAICEKLKEIVSTWDMDLDDKYIPVARKYTTGMEDSLKKARRIVGHYSQSSQARSRLQTILTVFKQPVLEVVQDVPTRWNSEYAVFEHLCTLKNSIMAKLASAQTSIKKLQDSEWTLFEGYVEVLAQFEEATREISTEQFPTSSCVITLLDGISQKTFDISVSGKFKKKNLCRRLQYVTNTLHSNDSEQSVDTSSDEQEESSVWDIIPLYGGDQTKRNFQHFQLSHFNTLVSLLARFLANEYFQQQ